MAYLCDIMHAIKRYWGIVIRDWYFKERMENSGTLERDRKRKKLFLSRAPQFSLLPPKSDNRPRSVPALELLSRAASSVGVIEPFQRSQHREQSRRRADRKKNVKIVGYSYCHLNREHLVFSISNLLKPLNNFNQDLAQSLKLLLTNLDVLISGKTVAIGKVLKLVEWSVTS